MIDSLFDRFSTAWLCRQLGVARSGFYDWRQRQHNPWSTGSGECGHHGSDPNGVPSAPRLLRCTAGPSRAQGRWPPGGPASGCPVDAQGRAQGPNQARVQALPQQQRQGRRCRREPPATRLFAPCTLDLCTAAVWPALRAALMAVLSGEVVVLTVSHSAGRAESSSMATDWERREVRLWWGKQKRVAAGCRRVRM